jgi:hypothetical protein
MCMLIYCYISMLLLPAYMFLWSYI